MKTVWIVSDEDSRTGYVCTTKDNADMIVGAVYGHYDASEMVLDEGVKELKAGMWMYNILMLRNGAVEKCDRVSQLSGVTNTVHIWDRPKAEAYKGKGIPACLTATVWGKNPRHAVKVVDGIRLAMIEKGEWVP